MSMTSVSAGHEDHGNVAPYRLGLQAPARLEPVESRHHHVEQNEVGPHMSHLLERALAALGHTRVVARGVQHIEQHAQVGRDIINEQKGFHRGRGRFLH
ncbi:MAG: hypothetical protein WDM96_02445 [Lacunisphaera sp.]